MIYPIAFTIGFALAALIVFLSTNVSPYLGGGLAYIIFMWFLYRMGIKPFTKENSGEY